MTSCIEELSDRLAVECIADAAMLDPLREAWNTLAGEVPFRRFEWLETWWRHYRQPNDQLFVIAIRDPNGNVIGLAPFYRSTSFRRLRTIRLLGSGEVASDYVTILVKQEYEAVVATHLASWLAENANEWDALELDGVSASDAVAWQLIDSLAARAHWVDRRVLFHTWRLTLSNRWEEYLTRLSKSRRERIKSLTRKAIDNGRAVVRSVESEDDLALGLRVLEHLHQRRRRSLGENGCFASRRFQQFHAEVAKSFLDQGRLRLRWLELDEQPAAVEYSLLGGNTIYYYQSGFDPDLAAERPGWLSLILSLRDATEQQYEVFDFLRGDEAYKASLGARACDLSQVRIAGHGAIARIDYALWLTRFQTRQWASRWMSLVRQTRRTND